MGKYYYTSTNGLEVIDVLSNDNTKFTEKEAFCFGNIIKYIARAGKKEKDISESLDKAFDYYKTLILDNGRCSDRKFKLYVLERIRIASFSLNANSNYEKFVEMIP